MKVLEVNGNFGSRHGQKVKCHVSLCVFRSYEKDTKYDDRCLVGSLSII